MQLQVAVSLKKLILKQIRESLLIMILGGIPTAYLMCPACFESSKYTVNAILFSSLIWVSLWKGNELIVCKTDQYLSWLEMPVKRFFVSLGLMLLYTTLAAIILTFIFYVFAFGQEVNKALLNSIIHTSLFSIGVTSVIMLIMFARSFLSSWRQSEINAEKLRREQITLQYETLKNQVNPHFLFNTLNALSSLIYEDKDKAIQFINKFSEVYRYVLDSKDKEVVSLEEELKFVLSFIFLMKTRYEENLIFNIKIQKPLTGFLSPMTLQLLVENAIKHNVISDESPLNIDIRRDEDNIVVENSMNPKPNGQKREGLGLNNIRSRYEILSDRKIRIENDGKTFKVFIPLLKME